MIQLSKLGMVARGSEKDLSLLRAQFDRQHLVRLPKFIEPKVLEEVLRRVSSGSFQRKAHRNIGVEVCLDDSKTLSLMNFLTNNSNLFKIIEQITTCGRIGCFVGRIYRMVPGEGHYDNWHTDILGNRLVALSVNLSPVAYSGGVLLLRDRPTRRMLQEIVNTGFGDAILFKLAPHLEHKITNVEGMVPKTAYAGWFSSAPDFYSELRKGELNNDGS
jgi:hypothetical protein